jgi:Restriction endonuclease BamHI
MKIVREETLIRRGKYSTSKAWQMTRASLYQAIRNVDWPRGSGTFTIYPESGKKRGEGNGVTPIKLGLLEELRSQGWKLEQSLDVAILHRPGKIDAVLETKYGPVCLEWETGNISSSHRALNKMAIGLMKGVVACGILVVPSRALYRFLTDRIGNFDELAPYLDLWRSIPCESGVLELVVIEHDATSTDVPRIPKGTSGRALQ